MFCTFHWNVFLKVQLTISPAWLRDWFSSNRHQVIIWTNDGSIYGHIGEDGTVYPKKYAHGFVVLCFVVVMQSFIINSHEVFIHIYQGCFAGTGAIVRLSQCQWSKPDGNGKISQCITTTKHSKAKTVCIFLGIYCTLGIATALLMIYTYKDIREAWPLSNQIRHCNVKNVKKDIDKFAIIWSAGTN